MAKHAHRLMLNQKKTWKCTLPNCRYFIHIGLAHILPGQQSICWGCGEQFELDERALQDDMPKCAECRARDSGEASPMDIEAYINHKLALTKAGVKSEDELTPMQRNTMKALGLLPDVPEIKAKDESDDEVEVYNPTDNVE